VWAHDITDSNEWHKHIAIAALGCEAALVRVALQNLGYVFEWNYLEFRICGPKAPNGLEQV
jgi:hypothetical protein